ncbi:SusC/RagA family TonB-linked outer membrane protein [Bernardetia litoralis]|nr:SusC/RagA family TonB-linked outer membrane protein [Bernardetia litoralis]
MLMSLMLIGSAWAQQTITGTVIDAAQGGLPGATVQVKGTNTGTTTDLEGKYSLVVPEGSEILVFRFVGYASQEVEIGNRTTIDVTLAEASELATVVVTAQNISREKASLAYSQQKLDGAEVSTVKETNFINSLSGKAAGVQVRQNNTMGGSTNITIRGNSSFTSNQPLFVVDGIPIGNNANNSASQEAGRGGYDYGNPASDINPEDIASMSILKGASATALYGSRGQNGVIIITTKKGSKGKGIGVSISTGITIGTIDKSTFAEYQDQYGAGYGAYYGSTGYFEDIDANGDGVADLVVPTTEDGSYGGAFDPNLNVYYWDSFVPESDNYGQSRPWTAAENSPVEFFETQVMYNNTVSLQGGNDNGTFRLSYNNLDQQGILPNSSLTKNTINFNGTLKLTEKLSSNVMFQYNKQDVVGRYSTGYSDNIMSNFRQWWQVNTDVLALKDIYDQTGKNYTWNAANPTDPETPIYWDNPYWTRYENYNSDTRDRVISKVGIDYKFTDWLNFSAFATIDGYTEVREERRAVGSVATSFGVNLADESSGYQRTNIEQAEYNYNAILSVNKMLSDDFSLAGLVGFNLRKERYQYSQQSTSGGIAVPELYSLSNSVNSNPFPYEYLYEKEVYGYFANANLGYKGFLYLDGNYRVDVSSALPTVNNQYDYYSIGLGFVFSELINVDQINYGKIRASYGTVGNDTRALRVNDVYLRDNNFQGGVLTTLPSTKNNSSLKPEITAETELGLELSMFKRRLNVDFAVYNRETKNQLLSVQLSRATGYNSTFINAGTIRNRGFELTLGGTAVKTAGFTYSPSVNFTLNRNKVLSLIGETENYVIADFQATTSNATVGQPLGVMRGTGYEYLDGERVVDENGYYVAVSDQIIGDPNPDWNMGINNMFTYKNFKLSFLIDIQKGGDVFSLDMYYGSGVGLYPETAGTNDLGNPVRDDVDAGGGVVLPGVNSDGTPNTTYADASYYGGAYYWGSQTRNPEETHIYDASSVRLRELSLSYSLPKTIASKIKATNIDFSIVGRNLWIISKNVPYADPESGLGVGTAQGYLSGSYPTVKTYGFKLDVSF